MNETEMPANEVSMRKLIQDFKVVLHDAEDLARATAGNLGEKVSEARAKLAASMASAKTSCQDLEEKAIAGAKATDRVIRSHPYESMGIAFGVGLLIGVLVGRK